MLGAARWLAPDRNRVASIWTFIVGALAHHTVSTAKIYVKLDYIASSLPQTACLGKICEPKYLGPKLF